MKISNLLQICFNRLWCLLRRFPSWLLCLVPSEFGLEQFSREAAMLNWFTVRMAYITEEVSTFSPLFLLVCFLGSIITSVLRGVIKEEKRVNTPRFVTSVGFLPWVLCFCHPFLTSEMQTGSSASLRAPPEQGGGVQMEGGRRDACWGGCAPERGQGFISAPHRLSFHSLWLRLFPFVAALVVCWNQTSPVQKGCGQRAYT